MGRMSVHLLIQYQHAQRVIYAGNLCAGLEASPSLFVFTHRLFPMPYKEISYLHNHQN